MRCLSEEATCIEDVLIVTMVLNKGQRCLHFRCLLELQIRVRETLLNDSKDKLHGKEMHCHHCDKQVQHQR